VVNKETKQILALNFCNGKKHDFRLFKESNLHINSKSNVLADTGYLGINQIMSNASIPHKRSKNHPLTIEQKQENHELSSKRILCENVIGSVKRFRVISERYRNRRKRFGLRFNLIAGIHNFEL
jgi:hypothetical protein